MYHCDYPGCVKSFATAIYLKGHVKRFHVQGTNNKKELAAKTAKNKKELAAKAVVEKSAVFKCRFCDNVYNYPGSRSRHEGIKHKAQKEAAAMNVDESQVRPFACSLCEKRFKAKADLTYHYMRHTGDFPVHCEQCGKGYISQSELKKHMARTHVTDELELALRANGMIQSDV
jgi:KRAB domain-containing zinc finger protein